MYCSKCGIKNEDGAKFCKSCGTPLSVDPIQPDNTNLAAAGNTFKVVKKIVIWGFAIFITFILIVNLINFIQEKNKEKRIQNLQSECTNNNAQSCYQLGTFMNDEEALAKGCQLGNKDACRAGGYYERGCDLQDGQSCYLYSEKIMSLQGIEGSVACGSNSASEECRIARDLNKEDVVRYQKLACDYGYSQGCMNNQ